jgi:hypothetical protein
LLGSQLRIFILPEANRRQIAKTQFFYCEVLLWSLKRFHPLSFAHPEFTETAVPADETNLSNARPRFGLCPTELESATAAGHVETMESMRISRL